MKIGLGKVYKWETGFVIKAQKFLGGKVTMKIFNVFNRNEIKGNAIKFKPSANEGRISPFSVYSPDEEIVTEQVRPTSVNEFMFLMNLETFYTDVEEEILKIIGKTGAVTSRQITQLLNPKFNLTQDNIEPKLKKLVNKNFIARSFFRCSGDGSEVVSKSSYSVYTLSYHGRKILQDMDELPNNSLYFKKMPAYKIKRILSATQIIIENNLQDNVIRRSSLLKYNNTLLRIEGVLSIDGKDYIVESVRKLDDDYMFRVNMFKSVIKEYKSFGFSTRPNMIIIGENEDMIEKIRAYSRELEKRTHIYYTYDNAGPQNIVDSFGTVLAVI